MRERKLQKYRYHKNRNKKRIALTSEQQREHQPDYMLT